jgi:hypothetical protein
MRKKNAPIVIAMMLKRTAITVMESKGGGVALADALLASEASDIGKLGNRYGSSDG